MTQATDSQMAMFRGIIALAWADHNLDQAEKDQLALFINANIHLSSAQRALLLDEVGHKVSIDTIWPLITDVHDRAHLINVAPVIFWNDDVFCENEQELYTLVQEKHMRTINQEDVENDIRALAKTLRLQHQMKNDEVGKIRRILRYLGTILP